MSSIDIETKIDEIVSESTEKLKEALLGICKSFKQEMEAEVAKEKELVREKEEVIERLEKELREKGLKIEEKEKVISRFKDEVSSYEKEINALKKELAIASDLVIKKDEEISLLESEKEGLRKELEESNSVLNRITSQLEEVSKQYQDLSKEKDKQLDALRLLDVYIVLLEKVFNSAPHVRILFVAHGEKSEWTIPELAKATGIEPLAVRRAIFELRNAGLFSYDENTGKARLLVRLWK